MSIPYSSSSTASSASAFAHPTTTAAPLLSLRALQDLHRARMCPNPSDYNANFDDLTTTQWLVHGSNDEEDIFSQIVPTQLNFAPTAPALSVPALQHQQQSQQHQQFHQHPHRQFSSGAHSFQFFEDFNSPTSSYYSAPTERSPFHHPDPSTSFAFTFNFPSYENQSLYPPSQIPSASSTVTPTPTQQYYNTSPSYQQWTLAEAPYQALINSHEALRHPESGGMHSASSSTSSYNTPPANLMTTSLPASISLSPTSTESSTGSVRKLEAFLPSLEMKDSDGRPVKRLRSKSDDVRETIPACDFCRKRKVKVSASLFSWSTAWVLIPYGHLSAIESNQHVPSVLDTDRYAVHWIDFEKEVHLPKQKEKIIDKED